jgi:hypothetical protein
LIRKSQIEYEAELYSFDPEKRNSALASLFHLLESGQVALVPELLVVNLHSHTFFSFNAYGYSPTGFAWEAKKRGLYAAGIIDFDVLDGVEEFLNSCELLGVRSVAGIESRVVVPEWKNLELNSPGEPGVCYFMGYGFTRGTPELRKHQPALRKMAFLAQKRNRTMLEKLNGYLGGLAISYERDVLPLSPSGNPTERHMLVALEKKAGEVYPNTKKRARFWADAMGMKDVEVLSLLERPVELQMLIRANLMKKGGPGYTAPDEESFPKLEEMIGMTRELGAAPTIGWLDGLSEGERDSRSVNSMRSWTKPAGESCP